jgi:hypothetical protein
VNRNEKFPRGSNSNYSTGSEVLHKKEGSAIATDAISNSIGEYVSIVSQVHIWKIIFEMQAEGGFGSRQIFAGCFASAIEFGPQRLTDKNTTRPALEFSVALTIASN